EAVNLSFRVLCIGDIFENVDAHLHREMSFTCALGAFEALGRLRCEPFDAVLARIPIPGCTTPETMLEEIQRVSHSVRVILCDPSMDVERAIALARRGAFDVVDEDRLNRVLARCSAASHSTAPGEAPPWRKLLIGE